MISVQNLSLLAKGKYLLKELSFKTPPGCSLAIVGASGVGKTMLGQILAGVLRFSGGSLHFLPTINKKKFVPQQQDFREYFQSRSYYQQRFDNNYDDTSPLVDTLIGTVSDASQSSFQLLKIDTLVGKHVISLSNGEAKRLQIYLALAEQADLYVFDNPFVGLDKEMRVVFKDILYRRHTAGKYTILICPEQEIPTHINHAIVLTSLGARHALVSTLLIVDKQDTVPAVHFDEGALDQIPLLSAADTYFAYAVCLKDVDVVVRDRVLFKGLCWDVRKGERWALIGPNGVGKSTLLSYITADHPQVYTNEVTVFDQQRGTGESVWDIKRRIGVVSPELHIYFMRENKQAYRAGTVAFDPSSLSLTVYQVVASGFDDHQGMATALTYSHRQLTSHWMTFLALQDYKDERFHLVSLGVQRLALLARALVKNPPLLVLDEPTQGLDAEQIRRFNALIDQICLAFSKTLIYVSHHQEHLPKCIERTLLLQEGGIWTIIDNNRQDRTSLVHLK